MIWILNPDCPKHFWTVKLRTVEVEFLFPFLDDEWAKARRDVIVILDEWSQMT